jgi:hypothetical protein
LEEGEGAMIAEDRRLATSFADDRRIGLERVVRIADVVEGDFESLVPRSTKVGAGDRDRVLPDPDVIFAVDRVQLVRIAGDLEITGH